MKVFDCVDLLPTSKTDSAFFRVVCLLAVARSRSPENAEIMRKVDPELDDYVQLTHTLMLHGY